MEPSLPDSEDSGLVVSLDLSPFSLFESIRSFLAHAISGTIGVFPVVLGSFVRSSFWGR